MKNKIALLLLLFVSTTIFSQEKREWGTKFDYDEKKEKDLKVVLVDNYNHFTVSVINIDGGMMPTNQIIIRKFDQKNQLVNTFTQEFPYKDVSTLHNYLGSFELGKDKIVVFTDCYSNKTKKKEIHKIIFDKKASEFTTTLITEFTFESLSKSGTTFAIPSHNKNYIGIVYSKFANKKIAEEHECFLLDGNTADLVWKKNIAFQLLSFTDNIVLNDNGKFIFVRNSKETGSKSILAVADGNTIENKDFGTEDVKIQKPISFIAGPNDYLIAFNSYAHGINRAGDYGKILVYDLNAGKVLKNNHVDNFEQIKDLNKINFNDVFVQNDEIELFVDCDFQTGTKPDPTFPNSTFKVPVYSNGIPTLLTFSMDGQFKKGIPLDAGSYNDPLIKSIGIINIGGNYYFNTGFYSSFYTLNAPDFAVKKNKYVFLLDHQGEVQEYKGGTVINQFCNYLPDSKKMLFAKSFGNGKIAFVSISGLEL